MTPAGTSFFVAGGTGNKFHHSVKKNNHAKSNHQTDNGIYYCGINFAQKLHRGKLWLRQSRNHRNRILQSKSAYQNIDQTPDRHHHKQSHNSVNHHVS